MFGFIELVKNLLATDMQFIKNGLKMKCPYALVKLQSFGIECSVFLLLNNRSAMGP